ncbi:ATP-binding protein [Streptomyces sp. NPDC048290]|uniref:ATP-binding protein n=1 Tax=Streptomyces sp. NPDC048290 TaxID=3155811 RepID=UPI00343F2E98
MSTPRDPRLPAPDIRAAGGLTPRPPTGPWHGTGPTEPAVVLYTVGVSARLAVRALAGLRDFAAGQGWRPAHEVYDVGPAHNPAPQRIGWRAVERLLIDRRAVGLVMPTESEVAVTQVERGLLRSWLGSLPAFVAYPESGYPAAPLPGPFPAADPPALPEPLFLRRWSRSYALNPASLCRVRGDVRRQLTLMGWTGDVPRAIQVVSRLTHNAVTHAQPADGGPARMTVRLSVPPGGGLVIDVQDPRPDLPLGKAALAGTGNGGLMDVRLLGAELSSPARAGARSKTVRARIRPV